MLSSYLASAVTQRVSDKILNIIIVNEERERPQDRLRMEQADGYLGNLR